MIRRIEYASATSGREAVIKFVGENHWRVWLLPGSGETGRTLIAKSLTSAQGHARVWCAS